MKDDDSKGEPPEQPAKITILLSLDTIEKIDQMAKIARFGSRGRTIQALVDTVTTSQVDMVTFLSMVNDMQKKGAKLTPQEGITAFTVLAISGSNVIQRLNQFLDLKFTG